MPRLPQASVLLSIVALCLARVSPLAAGEKAAKGVFDVREYGAAGDGKTLDTKAIQAALDAAAASGGGTVRLQRGTFLSGTIELPSRITLQLDAGAVLLASSRQEDFTARALIHAEKAENITVQGRGMIDGHGAISKAFPKVRAHLIHFVGCHNVLVRDVAFRNSTTWIQHYYQCDNVVIDGVTVDSRLNPEIEGPRHAPGAPGRNEDGLDINSCSRVRVANSLIYSDDDAIVLKSTSARPCTDIAITNCVVSSNAAGIKFGTESGGGFQNVAVSNCTIYDTRNSGLALEIVDGGTLDCVNVSNLVMHNIKGAAIFIRLGNRARPYRGDKPGVGTLRNVIISNVQATGVGDWIEPEGKRVVGCSITGIPGHPVENITLENLRVEYLGGGALEDAAREVKEREDAYPSCRMFGTLPAYGFYCRHARNLKFHHVELTFQHEDHRPPFVFDDVVDLELFDVDAQTTSKAPALYWLKQVNGAVIHGSRPRATSVPLVRVDGGQSRDISLLNNDLSRASRIVVTGEGVGKDAVYLGANRLK